MKKLIVAILTVFAGALCLPAQHHGESHGEAAKIAGTWQLTMDSPHGPLSGPFKVEQDGAKLTATYEAESMGTIQFTGTVQGTRVSFEVPGSDMAFKMTGTVEGDKMSGTTSLHDGSWKATRR
jgi:hypothetical protein